MTFQAKSIPGWPGQRALLLVHGVGNYGPGDYDDLKTALRAALGDAEWARTAVYEMYWDPISDQFKDKLQADGVFTRLIGQLKLSFDKSALGAAAAEGAGDVIWPVLVRDAREDLRTALVRQLQQIVADGRGQHIPRPEMQLWIACHSLGCFHTYEALFQAASDPQSGLRAGIGFEVIMFASPVQLIASVANAIRDVVPAPSRLFCLRNAQLQIPGWQSRAGYTRIARRLLSITGDLDPVGGYLFHRPLGWAYMSIPGTDAFVQPQQIAAIPDEQSLASLILDAVAAKQNWALQPNNPHDWVKYVENNADRIHQWWLA